LALWPSGNLQMTFIFCGEVEAALKESGWSADRRVNAAPLIKMADLFTPTERVCDILSSFGHLKIRLVRDGTQVVAWNELEFIPFTITSEATIREVTDLIGATFFPIADEGMHSVLLDDRDRVFVHDERYLALVADSFEGGVESIVLGRRTLQVIKNEWSYEYDIGLIPFSKPPAGGPS